MNSEDLISININSEVRHLPKQVVSELGNILQIDHSWKDIMGLIPDEPWIPGKKLPSGNFVQKYSSEDIRLVADECDRDGRTGFDILVEEWGTSGLIRPQVYDLINLLKKSGLERAANYLESITIGTVEESSDEEIAMSSKIMENNAELCMTSNIVTSNSKSEQCVSNEMFINLQNTDIPFIPFEILLESIKNGSKIGLGAFGFVYRSHISVKGERKEVAIKLLSENEEISKPLMKKENLFINEVEILSKCNHKNIIKLDGYSFNNTDLGLVYSYMKNGSLYDRLSCTNNTLPLSWIQRLDIAKGAAEGIVYLHTNFMPPLVHRDIKSPNILLDENLTPKLGDFGIVRLGSHGKHLNTVIKTTPIGTQMYMAPEAFRGDVSVKMDTFSFAVVILEMLTGLPYFDENRENRDILSYVQEWEDDEIKLLDAKAGDWNIIIGKKLFEFAEICTRDKKERPDMVQALNMLKAITEEKI